MSDLTDSSAWVLKAEHDLTAVEIIGSSSDAPWSRRAAVRQTRSASFLHANSQRNPWQPLQPTTNSHA